MQDVGDVCGGWTGTLSAGYATRLGARWLVQGEVAARLVSDDYGDTYFSVSSQGAAASGLAPFDADGGLHDIGFSATASYALTERLSLTGIAGCSLLPGDAADSAIVKGEGDANEFSAGLGVGFVF